MNVEGNSLLTKILVWGYSRYWYWLSAEWYFTSGRSFETFIFANLFEEVGFHHVLRKTNQTLLQIFLHWLFCLRLSGLESFPTSLPCRLSISTNGAWGCWGVYLWHRDLPGWGPGDRSNIVMRGAAFPNNMQSKTYNLKRAGTAILVPRPGDFLT